MPERIVVEPTDRFGDLRRVQAVLKVASILLPDTYITPMHRVETFPDEPVFVHLDSDEARGKKPFGFGFTRRLCDFNDTVKITAVVEKRNRNGQSVWVIQDTRLQRNTGRLSASMYSYPQFPGEIEIAKCVFDTEYTPRGKMEDSVELILSRYRKQADRFCPSTKFRTYKHRLRGK